LPRCSRARNRFLAPLLGAPRFPRPQPAPGLIVFPDRVDDPDPREKYPRWWFDWNLELLRFSNRIGVYRALLPSLGQVVTTPSGARRLGGDARGLEPWSSMALTAPDGTEVRVTATPCRHGPPLSRPLVGEVIGFVLEWGSENPALGGEPSAAHP
jgi:hypothetical protein